MEGDASIVRSMRSLTTLFLQLLVVLAAATSPVAAQTANEFGMEVRPFGAAVSLAHRLFPGVFLGLAAGGGVDVLDRTLAPNTRQESYHSFQQLAHVSAFLRQKPNDRLDVDLGIRAGVGGVRACGNSDCWPGGFVGLYGAAFWGTPRFKIGPRLLWAMARNGGWNDPVLYAELITVRFRF